MSLDAEALFALLPAIYRTRDAATGGALKALFEAIGAQSALVEHNIEQLYDDQFIETCTTWAIPYIADLIGYESIHQTDAGLDSRAEVANTIGYRRRKGTLIALEQVAKDVSGRAVAVIEEFKRLIVSESLRHPRPRHTATLDLRRTAALERLGSPFDTANRTIDVRWIAPRRRPPATPDPTALDIALHGAGRHNIPDVAIHVWRWQSWQLTRAPAFQVDAYRFRFNSHGRDAPLFVQAAAPTQPFTRLTTRLDVPEPIRRGEFARRPADFYGASVLLFADGAAIDAAQIIGANLADRPGAAGCLVPAGKIAIDPELGRIQFAADLTPPASLRVTYSYGFAAALGGGPYDRSAAIANLLPAQPALFAVVGSDDYPSIESAITQWNSKPPGSAGIIVLPNFERHDIDLTGANAVQLPVGSTLLLAAAQPVPAGGPHDVIWNHSCATVTGSIEVIGVPGTALTNGVVAEPGRLAINGLWIDGQLRIGGVPLAVQISDSTLVPGLGAALPGVSAGEPSIVVGAGGCALSLLRAICGPIDADAAGTTRICSSIIDATSACCVAYSGADSAAGADLHIEDSTVIGRVRTRTMTLASNSLFVARLGSRDPWPAAIWCSRRQVGCVRFCSLPFDSITPARYECLPATRAAEAALQPRFVTLRYGEPSYGLLCGDVPLAVWHGADNGSQMGVYAQIQETEAVSNVQIRAPEYLPVGLESGIFLHPSRPLPRPVRGTLPYGVQVHECCDGAEEQVLSLSIGDGLL